MEHIRTRKMSDQVHDLPWTNDSIEKINTLFDKVEDIHQAVVEPKQKRRSIWWYLAMRYHIEPYQGHANSKAKDCYECQQIVALIQRWESS